MVADYFTTARQGAGFKKTRNTIMNTSINVSLDNNYAMEDCRSVLDIADDRTKESDGKTKELDDETKNFWN
jgi:hypothetical protein